MVERPKRTSQTFFPLPHNPSFQKHLTRSIAILLATLTFFGACHYLFHAEARINQIVLFVMIVWTLALVIDFFTSEKAGPQDLLTETEKLQSQKMEAIGRLAGGVAHDFNNLLAVITGYSDLMLESLGPSDLNRTKLEQIKQAANSAASLTRQLLMFSRQQIIQPVILDLNQIVSSTEKMVRRLIKENIEFSIVLEPKLDRINADPGQIEQVILNLIVNARDAMPNGGNLHILTSNVRMDNAGVHSRAGELSGGFVLLQVSDTGTGMDEETQTHIFEPFFTTKALGKGTGLGLATVYGIVKQNNGHIEVQSTVGRGSCFKIYLPVVKVADANYKPERDRTDVAFSGESVLVVEDAQSLRELICEVLSELGCTVLSACNAQEALQLAREQQRGIDLLLTDVIMPGMDGTALARELRRLRPDVKTLYMTGYSGEFLRADMLIPGVSLIRKPFTPDELGGKVRKMLVSKPGKLSAERGSKDHGVRGSKADAARASG